MPVTPAFARAKPFASSTFVDDYRDAFKEDSVQFFMMRSFCRDGKREDSVLLLPAHHGISADDLTNGTFDFAANNGAIVYCHSNKKVN